ncbi:HD domain-containing protein [Pseudosulfitobacter pseudonitzschiae]|nr:YfbR-like 5'-deoxynucleotidase [Pseudosulfitobacter pseudonitzschiae]SHG02049.1 HD domain-containing protein [Pseudosulfitobacter pseudonitzschiae]
MIGAAAVSALSGYLSSVIARIVAHVWGQALRLWCWPLREAVSAPSAWHAGAVLRWHAHRHLAGSGDRVDGHSARVAILILQFWPYPRAELLKAALTHDLGEFATGDIPGPVKRSSPELYAGISDLEAGAIAALGFEAVDLMPYEAKILRLADGFDAYLWALHHAPAYVRRSAAWRALLKRLRQLARELGVVDQFNEILRGVSDVRA